MRAHMHWWNRHMIPAALAVAAAVIAALFVLLTPKPAHAQGLSTCGPAALLGVSPTARLPGGGKLGAAKCSCAPSTAFGGPPPP